MGQTIIPYRKEPVLMFTATDGIILPTTVTGSWPRPIWFDTGLWGKPLSTGLADVKYREQFTDAVSAVITDQERAGLDILTNGDFHLDPDLGGRAWLLYPVERLHGVTELDLYSTSDEWAYPPGHILHEVMGGWRYPAVDDKVERGRIPLEFAKIWRIAQARTERPVKFGVVSAQVAASVLEVTTDEYARDKRELMWDMAVAFNEELRELVAAGCKVIQTEDPIIHFVSLGDAEPEYMDFLVEVFNREMDGLDGAEIWIHTCWGNPNMQRVLDETSYAKTFEIYLERLKGDVWTVEMKDRNQQDLELFAPFKQSMKKKVAIGVVSHRQLQVETPEEVAQQTRNALRYINPENLVLTSDCGFGRQGSNRLISFYKAAAIAQGAQIVRRELGVDDKRRIPAAEPDLQVDVPKRDRVVRISS
jgi:5-methyltetrahydropteroyltriglutamate--homocysteine methyltransferase